MPSFILCVMTLPFASQSAHPASSDFHLGQNGDSNKNLVHILWVQVDATEKYPPSGAGVSEASPSIHAAVLSQTDCCFQQGKWEPR